MIYKIEIKTLIKLDALLKIYKKIKTLSAYYKT